MYLFYDGLISEFLDVVFCEILDAELSDPETSRQSGSSSKGWRIFSVSGDRYANTFERLINNQFVSKFLESPDESPNWYN